MNSYIYNIGLYIYNISSFFYKSNDFTNSQNLDNIEIVNNNNSEYGQYFDIENNEFL